MGDVFTPLDLFIFFAALIGAMVVGMIAGRKENTSEDYFLAGRGLPWWGVAGSIFGSNVSANHMVGMMGIGFSIGFAQAHFELGAIAGLMVLCYGFLPVYRKLNLYTLSEYLGRRYDDRSRVAYAIIMVIIMAFVQMVPGLYIGSRTICVLLGGDALVEVAEEVETLAGETGAESSTARTKLDVDFTYYALFVIALAVISASYTIFGGLKAVVWTDVIQSCLLLAAGIVVAVITFHRIGGWGAMMAIDQGAGGADKMSLYLPMDHPDLPWTGAFTGLMAMHFFYWGTNQFIVQRALGARSDSEGRIGIVAAGFLKLLIPFFAIGAGIAAFYLFQKEMPDRAVDPDAAFSELVKLVIPVGYGIIGIIAAGLIGAILSSIDSMMNSAATILTMDLYKPYVNPNATDKELIRFGRLSIVALVVMAALMAIFILDPNSEANFFLQLVDYQNYLSPGVLVTFILGMFWRRATATGSIVTILSGVFFSWLVEWGYNNFASGYPGIVEAFGPKLAFFHRVVFVLLLCFVIHIIVSLMTLSDSEKSRLVWTDLGGHAPGTLVNSFGMILVSIGVYALLGWVMVSEMLSPTVCGVLGMIWTWLAFSPTVVHHKRQRQENGASPVAALLIEDRFWAAILCSMAVFMLYHYR
ncbi:MAG: sodium/solute symporter [Planctomycetaceae bacterium]|nr:sodium/solute symporter [Planctomycetaceae bacterium]